MSEVMWVWDYELKTLGSWPSTGYNGHNTPVEVVTQMDVKALRDERDRLLKIVEYGAAIDNALFMRGEHVETYEARCRYLADRCRKLLAALTPAGGGQDE